ncbi:MAG: DUF1826 domain-containing protein [Alphaproteobacteria bacterium]|nr:DUF1826 domain-containing protein [Alphaproteobacteria bacterium]
MLARSDARDLAADRVTEGARSSCLDRIAQPNVALAIWRRPAPRGLAAWLDALPADRLPDGRFVAEAADVARSVEGLCVVAGMPDGTFRRRLAADVASLATLYGRFARRARLQIRLEAIDHDSCRRFHRDHVGLRLNVTYRGPATQWPALGDEARALRTQRRYRGPLNELPRFAVGLFKGVPLIGERAIVHRSPPVAGRGITRLFLCIDEENDDG